MHLHLPSSFCFIPVNAANYIHKDDNDEEPKKKQLKANNENALGVPEALIFKPMVSISLWKDEARHQNVSVAFAMPASITKKEDSKVSVLDDQSTLKVDVRIPEMLSNVDKLHSYWNRGGMTTLPLYRLKIKGHKDFFANLRKREADTLFGTTHIKLPVLVQKNTAWTYRYGGVEGSILYVDLEGVNKNEYKVDDGEDFVLLDSYSHSRQTH